MSFFAVEPTQDDQQIIQSSAFWPDIDTAKLRETMRLDGTVTDPRLIHSTISAVSSVNSELSQWRQEKQAEGHNTLDAVPAEQINNESVYVHLYARAIYSLTRANLIERLRDYDTTGAGDSDVDALADTITNLQRDARFAIRDILGKNHSTVELI
ncbi:head completion/stabilization protein [Idiomarina abyssalis]|uniref:head completion/stabilization protein n=1 Tax=Idiomarina abyssalis TaxID=86102 RepID=UPI001CD3C74D|nr:head completion/stabilization protein [Idiomarina abyssalis]